MKKAFIYFNLLTPLIVFAQDDIIVDKSLNKDDILVDKSFYQEEAVVAKEYKGKKLSKDKVLAKNTPIVAKYLKQIESFNATPSTMVSNPSSNIVENIATLSNNIDSEQIYMIDLNKQWNFVSSLVNRNDEILISKEYMPEDLLVSLEKSALIEVDGKYYLKVSKNLIISKDDNNYKLTINLPIELFKEQKIKINGNNVQVGNPVSAFYGRYDTNLSKEGLNNSSSLISTTYVNEKNWSVKNDVLIKDKSAILLNFQWRKFNEDKTVIYVGDVSSQSLVGTNSLNLFGVRYSTPYFNNYNFIQESLPIIPISGYAVNPTQLDLYINNQLIQKTDISTGKYNLHIPMQQSGFGIAQAYVYDVLGKPTVIDVPFYNTNNIIRPGKYEYDVSLGFIKKDLAIKSFSYGVPVVQGLVKAGITSNYTQDLFIQSSSLYTSAGVLSHWVPSPYFGSLKIGVTANSYNQQLLRAGYDRISNKWSIGGDVQKSGEFCPGYDKNICIKSQVQAYANTSKEIGSFGINYVNRETTKGKNTVLSLQWTKNLSHNLSMSANLNKISNEYGSNKIEDKSFYIGLNYALGNGLYSFTHLENNNYQQTFNFNNGSNSELGNGSLTFNARDGQNSTNLYYKNNAKIIDYQVNYLKNKDNSYGNVNLSGGFAYIPEGNVFALTRPSNNGIIYVDVENATSPVKVLHQNKVYGTTDKNGKLIISDAVPFNSEYIEVDLDSLSDNITLERTQTKVQMPAAGVTKIKFATKPMPFDITIKNVKEGTIFYIGNDSYVVGVNGETSVDKAATITLHENGKKCVLDIKPEQKEYICEYN
jgi:outer membrane usher protein FimD/PapC